MLYLSFIPTFLDNDLQNALVNFGSPSNTITLGTPWCLHHPLIKAMRSPMRFGSTMSANLANRSIITKMTLYPYDSDKLLMKSMHILCRGTGGIGNGGERRPCLW